METLRELTDDYRALLEFGSSDDPDDVQVFMDTLDAVLGAIEVKADGYADVIAAFEQRVDACKAEAARLNARAKVFDNRITTMKNRLRDCMNEMGKKKIETDMHTFSVVKNGGKLGIEFVAEVPQNYLRVVYEQDTDKIRKDLEAGQELSFAVLKERGTHLVIK